jgi:hypothetical protein
MSGHPQILKKIQEESRAVTQSLAALSTGAFGILGLLTEFRNKHAKLITVWGWISLLGIVVSTIGGTLQDVRVAQHLFKLFGHIRRILFVAVYA